MGKEHEEPPSVTDIVVRAAIQASPRLAGSLQVLYDGVMARRRARVDDAVAEVLERCSEGDLLRRMEEREEVEILVTKMGSLALESGLASKRRLLGRVVVEAVIDDAKVDRGFLLLGVLAQLDIVHARCLEDIARAEEQADAAGERGPTAMGAERELSQRVIETGRRHDPLVLHQLVAFGLLDATLMADGTSLVTGLTDSGRLLLTDLRSAGLDEDLR